VLGDTEMVQTLRKQGCMRRARPTNGT